MEWSDVKVGDIVLDPATGVKHRVVAVNRRKGQVEVVSELPKGVQCNPLPGDFIILIGTYHYEATKESWMTRLWRRITTLI